MADTSKSKTAEEHLSGLLNERVVLETREGAVRHGRLTDVRRHRILAGGDDVAHVPTHVYLDGESGDPIPLTSVVRLHRDSAAD